MIPIVGQGPTLTWQDGLWLLARASVGSALLLSALAKTSSRGSFDDALSHYRVVPRQFVPVLAPVVITIEAALGLTLIAGYAVTWAAVASACLLTIFAIAMSMNLLAGERSPCGCGTSQNQSPISWQRVAANLGVSALVFTLALTTASTMPPSLAATLTVLGIGLSAQLLLHIWRLEKLVPRYMQRYLIHQAERYRDRRQEHARTAHAGEPLQTPILPVPAHEGYRSGPGQVPRSNT
jgi:uncharacterized membrane protein YphA (DoxX/SURF4 family)